MVARRIDPPVECPTCGSPVPERARFCPVCQRPRRIVEQQLRQAAENTGTPYETLLQWAQDEDARNPLPLSASAMASSLPEVDRQVADGTSRSRRSIGCIGIIGAVLVLALIGALADGDDDSADRTERRSQSAAASQPTATQTRPSSSAANDDAVYTRAFQTITGDMASSMDRFTGLISSPQIGESSWTVQVAAELVTWDTKYRELQSLSPPPAYVAVHNKTLQAMQQLTSAADDIAVGIDTIDADRLNMATAKIERGNELLGEASDLMPR